MCGHFAGRAESSIIMRCALVFRDEQFFRSYCKRGWWRPRQAAIDQFMASDCSGSRHGAAGCDAGATGIGAACLVLFRRLGVVSPYGAGPSPIYYGSGYLPARDYWRLGGIFGLIFLTVFLAVGVPWVLLIK